jgi:hypothetical protein
VQLFEINHGGAPLHDPLPMLSPYSKYLSFAMLTRLHLTPSRGMQGEMGVDIRSIFV